MSAQRQQVPDAQRGGVRRNPLHVVLATCVVCAAAALLSGFAVLRHGAHLDAGHASIGLLQQPSSSNVRTRSARSESAGILSAGEDSDRRLPFVSASSLGLYNRLKAISKNIVLRRIAQSLRSRIAAGGSKALKPAVLTQLAATNTPPASLGRAPADDASAGPWEFPGEPGLFSALKRRLGQVAVHAPAQHPRCRGDAAAGRDCHDMTRCILARRCPTSSPTTSTTRSSKTSSTTAETT